VRNCWKYAEATDIIIGNSSLLSNDVISMQPLLTILNKNERLNFRYSMLVRQYGITPQAYQYWTNIKSNSQQLGSLFDQQPTQLKGNITAMGNPDEPVIGFVSAASQQQKRIFVSHDELINWAFDAFTGYNCAYDFIQQNPVDPYIFQYSDANYVPWYFTSAGFLYVINKSCVDCTLKGGSNQKPSFW
jgi:hypothetical protein